MIRPILACEDPYRTGMLLQQAGWTLEFSQPPESGDPLVGVSLFDNTLLLGVTEGYLPKDARSHKGSGVVFYLTVPDAELQTVHQNHRNLCPTPLTVQPWGDLAFEVRIDGYALMIAGDKNVKKPLNTP